MVRTDQAVSGYDERFLAERAAARNAKFAMLGEAQLSPEQQAVAFRDDIAHAPFVGREMAGPYVQSFYNGHYDAPATLPNWLAHASTDHVRDFMDMDAAVRGELQEVPTVQHTFLEVRHQFLEGLQHGIDAGWVTRTTDPSGRRNEHIEHMKQMSLRIGGIGETYLQGQEAYLDNPARMVVVAPGVGRTLDERTANTRHRIDAEVPAVLGSMYGRGTMSWVRTGFAEHLSQVVYNGKQAVFHPGNRGETQPKAAAQRELLSDLLAPGGVELARLFTLAMTSKDVHSQEWRMFRSAFDQAWSVTDGFDTVSRYVNSLHMEKKRTQPEATEAGHQQAAAAEALHTLRSAPLQIFGKQLHARRFGILGLGYQSKHRGQASRHRA